MNIYLLLVILLFSFWLIGAVLAVLEMWMVNVLILSKYCSEYDWKEFVEGFFKSWVTMMHVTKVIVEELKL